jgi:hypothetical protein
MPITFRCQSCRNKLSTARRKAGSTVSCPNCGADVRVPTAAERLDTQAEPLLATAGAGAAHQPAPPTPERTHDTPPPDFGPTAAGPRPSPPPPPAQVVTGKRPKPSPAPPLQPAALNDLPLFEREDFAELLEQEAEGSDDEPLPLPKGPAPSTPPADGLFVTRSTATMVMAAVLVLLGLAFAAGFLVGSRG